LGDRLAGGGPPTAKATPQPSGGFTVQTGAFSTLSKAKAEAAKLASRGITRTLPLRDPRGKTLYAVQIGRFQSKLEADRFRKSLGRTAFVTTAD
jgi:cell division protein FtsN